MADLDLTPIVEAVARARWENGPLGARAPWGRLPERTREAVRKQVNVADLAAALPVIDRLVREQIAQQIEQTEQASKASLVDRPKVGPGQFLNDWQWAARIARGGAA